MMKWFLVIILNVFCFSSLAQVVCRSPENIGEEGSEAGSLSSACNEAVLAARGDASDRETNNQKTVQVLTAEDKTSAAPVTPSGRGDDSGVTK